MKSKLSDPVGELGMVLPGDALEALKDILEDPGADHSAGQLARLGQCFTDIGAHLTTQAKQIMEPRIRGGAGASRRHAEDGAIFEWRRGGSYLRVDTMAIKALYAETENPDLYTTSERSDSISITYTDAK